MRQTSVLVTGGSGFFGRILVQHLLEEGYYCVSVDLLESDLEHPHLTCIQADVRDALRLEQIMKDANVEFVVHCAALLAHVRVSEADMQSINVDGTRSVALAASRVGAAAFVFISTNCLWAQGFEYPVAEDEAVRPIESYGRSKRDAEMLLLHEFGGSMRVVVIRTPTIIDAGRLGLLSILFEFVEEGKKVWMVGRGDNRYQFIFAGDLARAVCAALRTAATGTFHVGSDNVPTMREMYRALIVHAGSNSTLHTLPRWLVLPALALLDALRLSPLGPYQYRMISESFIFDTSRARSVLGWTPTLSNSEILTLAYDHFANSMERGLGKAGSLSPHRQRSRLGVLRFVKWLS